MFYFCWKLYLLCDIYWPPTTGCVCQVMQRKVRFAFDKINQPSPESQIYVMQPKVVDSGHIKDHDSDFVSSAKLAQQRGHEAMMLARTVQRKIRCQSEIPQRPVTDDTQISTQIPKGRSTRTKNSTCIQRHRPKQQDILIEMDFLSVPITWISNVFRLE